MENKVLDNNLQINVEELKENWAGFWVRVGASLIDFLVYLPLIGLNMYNLYILKSLPLQLIVAIIITIYKPFMEYRYGATLGKMAVKIRVVNLNFQQLTISQSILRNFPYLLSQIISIASTIMLFQHSDFQAATSIIEVGYVQNEVISPLFNLAVSFFILISCIIVAFTARKQGLHDLIAKTYCIYRES